MAMPPTLIVTRLGSGVKPSVLAIGAGEWALDRTTDCAIFAYTHIVWLRPLRTWWTAVGAYAGMRGPSPVTPSPQQRGHPNPRRSP